MTQLTDTVYTLARKAVDSAHKKAALQAVASLVKNYDFSPAQASRVVAHLAAEQGYQLGNLWPRRGPIHSELLRYARGVAESDESSANQYWDVNGHARYLVGKARQVAGVAS